MKSKLLTLTRLRNISRKLKREGKKIVLCHGVFDLVHPGHIRHFHSAKQHGDVLIVTVTSDRHVRKGPGRPIFPEMLRAEVLASIEHIDYVSIVNAESAVEPIKAIRPDYYVKGPDYKIRRKKTNIESKLDEEAAAVLSIKGQLVFTDDPIVYSSSSIINAYFDSYPQKTKEYLVELRKRFSNDEIFRGLSDLSNLKILVLGDAIIDQYVYCLPLGKSSKEPVMVHRYVSDESFAGGTLATANNLAALSSQVTLVTVLGRKMSFERFIRKHLKKAVTPKFFYREGSETIIKRRFVDESFRQKLFQITYLRDDDISSKLEREILNYIRGQIGSFDIVLVNDFGHGVMTDKLVRLVCSKAKYLALNVQANSANYGYNVITKYPRADYVCIDDAEIRLALHDKTGELHSLIRKISKRMKCRQIVVTKGPKGAIAYNGKEGIHESPALTDKIVDRIGAGDALFAITSPCVYAGMRQDLVSFIGNVAGAIQVQVVGNRSPIEFDSLARFITRLLK